jgi:opacity protein-like surface antigen
MDLAGATLANANPSGWTVGGGVEWVVDWAAFVEYNYLDVGIPGVSFTSNLGGAGLPIKIKLKHQQLLSGHQLSIWPHSLLIEG